MKSGVILLVALTMLLKPLWPVADYIVNYDYIVNVLCENKDEPELQCDGKCYLSKMLAEEIEDEGTNPFEQRRIGVEQVQPICLQSLLGFDLLELFCFPSKEPFGYFKILFSSPHILELIQPPESC